jgi:hypothetical protein
MQFTRLVAVDESLVDKIWLSASKAGSLYSIGDGSSKEVLRKVLFKSSFVVEIEGGIVRAEDIGVAIELHPVATGPAIFRHARAVLQEIAGISQKVMPGKPLCCIIPKKLRGAISLASRSGMKLAGECSRVLTGIPIDCLVYVWEGKHV